MPKLMPAILNQWTVFLNDERNPMLGIADEVEKPDIKFLTDTLNGAGVWGEVEVAATGLTEAMELKVTWNILSPDYFKLINTTDIPQLTFLGCQQYLDPVTSAVSYKQEKMIVRGGALGSNLGKYTKGKKGEPEVTLGITYIKDIIEGETLFEVDKLNGVYVINGVDLLAPIKERIGLA